MNGESAEKATIFAIILNVFLFAIKLAAGLLSGSLAVLSDALNSFLDIFSYIITYASVRLSNKGPDSDHPFGHRRAEPLAAILVAMFAGILAFEILKEAVQNMFMGEAAIQITDLTFGVLLICIVVKIGMFLFLGKEAKKNHSSSMEALSMDSRNDVFSTSIALGGIAGAFLGMPLLDDLAAILIAVYIFRSAYLMASKNIDYLMGACPDAETVAKIWNAAESVKGIKRVGGVRAHYVGDRIHAELDIVLSKKLKASKTHQIAEKVQTAVEAIARVERAFVHIDYE
jgi:cation diffusion facilitator family transporter